MFGAVVHGCTGNRLAQNTMQPDNNLMDNNGKVLAWK